VKVALVAEWLDPWRGGAETSTQQFLHRLMDRGVDLHLFTRSRLSPTPGLHVHCLNGAAMSRRRQSAAFLRRVECEVSAEQFDIIHAISPCRFATFYQPRGGTVAETIERNIAMRTSATARRVKRLAIRWNRRQQYLLRLERSLFEDPDGPIVIALSDYVVAQLKGRYSLPDSRIRKVFNGVDVPPASPRQRDEDRLEIRRSYRVPEDAFVVLTVAHNFRLKGVHRWMQALAMLRSHGRSNIRALVIGRGETAAWHRLADRLRLGDSLTFVGQTDRVEKFYHAGDVLVHPTYYDPCSRVVLEALARGLPCVTTQWDGAAELIADGQNGFVLDDPADVRQLARVVESLRDPIRRAQMGRAAAAAATDATMARHTDQMLALYADVAGQNAARDARTTSNPSAQAQYQVSHASDGGSHP
jgi:UDP-glucose:(heptosyl)LPS alpha-1,3-glucosyltransferase